MIYSLAGAPIGAVRLRCSPAPAPQVSTRWSTTPLPRKWSSAPVNMAAVPRGAADQRKQPRRGALGSALFRPGDWYDNTGEPRASKNGGKGLTSATRPWLKGQYNRQPCGSRQGHPDWAKNKLGV